MNKCKGCGILLQCSNPNSIGYAVNLNQDYCQRCFRLSHYGDLSHFSSSYVNNEKIIDIYSKYSNYLFVVIVDILDSLILDNDDLLDYFKDYNVVLVINKTDILPLNISENKLDNHLSKMLFKLNISYPNIKSVILTNKFERKFNELFFDTLNSLNYNKIVFAGRANAGKSSLINKLINSKDLTTSIYPGTTLDEVKIDYQDYIFIDTPGLVDNNNYVTYLNKDKYKLSKIEKTIKPQTFQLYEPQSYFYQGLLRIDIVPINNSSISFYINENSIHRTKLEKADDYYQLHYKDFELKVKPLVISKYHIKDEKTIVIKGLGFIKIIGECDINIHSLKDVKLYESRINL